MRILLSFLLCAIALSISARQITYSEAELVASEFLGKRLDRQISLSLNNFNTQTDPEFSTSPYYIFNAADNQGFVIISGDNRTKKILGYSTSGHVNVSSIPPQLSAMLNSFSEALTHMPSSAPVDETWTKSTLSETTTTPISLDTPEWGQDAPYNNECPLSGGTRCPTGCVATAMAIVMKYHNWPNKTRGSQETNFYDSSLTVDFNETPINWTSIEANDANAEAEISHLMLLAGISVGMKYEQYASGAAMPTITNQLISKFKYSSNCKHIERRQYSTQQWRTLIREQLEKNQPIIYGGDSWHRGEGHTFVLDGEDEGGNYHINWGWNGDYNGFYDLDGFYPSSFDCGSSHSMIIDMSPDKSNKPTP